MMARPKKTDAPDLGEAQDLTTGLIERMTCPVGKLQTFMRDTKAPGLRVRATPTTVKNPNGVKAFVFEAKLNRQTISRTIGDVRAWTIDAARTEANRLRVTLDAGTDPRELDRAKEAAAAVQKATDAAHVLTVAEVWAVYLAERRPHWGERHYQDHLIKAAPGGIVPKRGTTLTVAGPLAALMSLPLRSLDAATIEAWATVEGKARATSARLSWRLLKGFLGWCSEQSAYASLLHGTNPAKTKKSREALGKPGVKADVLQREQLPVWFAAIQQIQNPLIAAYLQIVLLTGARPSVGRCCKFSTQGKQIPIESCCLWYEYLYAKAVVTENEDHVVTPAATGEFLHEFKGWNVVGLAVPKPVDAVHQDAEPQLFVQFSQRVAVFQDDEIAVQVRVVVVVFIDHGKALDDKRTDLCICNLGCVSWVAKYKHG